MFAPSLFAHPLSEWLADIQAVHPSPNIRGSHQSPFKPHTRKTHNSLPVCPSPLEERHDTHSQNYSNTSNSANLTSYKAAYQEVPC